MTSEDRLGDRVLELHRQLLVDCLAELRSCFVPGQPEHVLAIVENPGDVAQIGFAHRSEVAESLIEYGTEVKSEGIRAFAADLMTLRPAPEGSFHCVVVYRGLASCCAYDLRLLDPAGPT